MVLGTWECSGQSDRQVIGKQQIEGRGGGGDRAAVVPTVAVTQRRGICGWRWGVVSRKKSPLPISLLLTGEW